MGNSGKIVDKECKCLYTILTIRSKNYKEELRMTRIQRASTRFILASIALVLALILSKLPGRSFGGLNFFSFGGSSSSGWSSSDNYDSGGWDSSGDSGWSSDSGGWDSGGDSGSWDSGGDSGSW